MFGSGKKKAAHFADDVQKSDGESTPLLVDKNPRDPEDRRSAFQGTAGRGDSQSFRRKRRSSLVTGELIPPSAALVSLINGGTLPPGAMSVKDPHPSPRIKSMPAYAPYPRNARHRSFYLRWLNEFRHWWKSSRLLVRLAGLYFTVGLNWSMAIDKKYSLTGVDLYRNKGGKFALKLVKLLGHGGPMRGFLKDVQPFTRTVRIVVATWRWIEAAPCRRLEVGVEELSAFVGNRCSRIFSRLCVDVLSYYIVFPIIHWLLRRDVLWFHRDTYDAANVIVVLGVLRAIAPYAASFQGSRIGRVFTRGTFFNADNRWRPVQRIQELNLHSEDCEEGDEVTEDAELLPLARKIAAALGKADTTHRIREELEELGFQQMGLGAGGYSMYQHPYHAHVGSALLLHVTPYGPSIMDILPLYIILEREESADLRKYWSQSVASLRWSESIGPKVLEGFCYQGAYFSMHHFACMRVRYDEIMMEYSNACSRMPRRRARGLRDEFSSPPADLDSLKKFLETGRRGRDQRKTRHRKGQTSKRVDELAAKLSAMMNARKGDESPDGVILYFEGLDCAGKSSTGNLIRDALSGAGYELDMVQYNRPPTAEQRMKPWMDRFQLPVAKKSKENSSYQDEENQTPAERKTVPGKAALIWDRGPGGDFVYGDLAKASDSIRKKRYAEFLAFDKGCRDKNILFLKLFFITDRDSIATTLGKRLAHKKICQDLHIWLDASFGSGVEMYREGLDEIDLHIDPTDFIAFNAYHNNLHKFSTFVRNTDVPPTGNFENPWVVVSTIKRHPARLGTMNAFEKLLATFHKGMECCKKKNERITGWKVIRFDADDPDKIAGRWKSLVRMVLYFIGLVVLYWYYCRHIWNNDD